MMSANHKVSAKIIIIGRTPTLMSWPKFDFIPIAAMETMRKKREIW